MVVFPAISFANRLSVTLTQRNVFIIAKRRIDNHLNCISENLLRDILQVI
jgi:hypothetical protein